MAPPAARRSQGLLSRLLPGPLSPAALGELDAELRDRLSKAPLRLNAYGYDPYGLNLDSARRLLLPNALLYRHYFRVETFGIERVPAGGFLLIANHAGQFAWDGSMLATSMLLEAEPPRVARGMGEYFLWRVPFFGLAASRAGTMVGTPENCVAMLEAGECVMVFPEGARGANKPFYKRYQLQRFGLGFMRIALESGVPVVPVGIVGSEEQQPGFANLEDLGGRFGLPSLPITISSPWLGLAGPAFALPVKYRIHFGEPMHFEGDPNEEDVVVEGYVERVKDAMRELIDRGLRERKGIFT